MTLPLPDPWIGPDASQPLDEDYNPKQIAEKLNGIQRNFEALASTFPLLTNNLARIPQARVSNSTSFSVPNNTFFTLTFDTEVYDHYPAGFAEQHSTSSNTSRLTCRVPGLYAIGGSCIWASNTVGERQIRIALNTSTYIDLVNISSPGFAAPTIQTHYRLAVGDYVEFVVEQSSGGTLNVSPAVPYSPLFYFTWLSP